MQKVCAKEQKSVKSTSRHTNQIIGTVERNMEHGCYVIAEELHTLKNQSKYVNKTLAKNDNRYRNIQNVQMKNVNILNRLKM